jgi:hypothetical protein
MTSAISFKLIEPLFAGGEKISIVENRLCWRGRLSNGTKHSHATLSLFLSLWPRRKIILVFILIVFGCLCLRFHNTPLPNKLKYDFFTRKKEHSKYYVTYSQEFRNFINSLHLLFRTPHIISIIGLKFFAAV